MGLDKKEVTLAVPNLNAHRKGIPVKGKERNVQKRDRLDVGP